MNRPTYAGPWVVDAPWDLPMGTLLLVVIEESPTMGRYCRTLYMGGCAQMGYADWSGTWYELV